jgi:tetratricopeptide (TPR) repeat protein
MPDRPSKPGTPLDRLRKLLDTYGAEQDPQLVLSQRAPTLAKELWESEDDPESNLAVLHAVGWMHWYRFQCLPDDQEELEFAAAIRLLAPVYGARPDMVPDPLRHVFDDQLAPRAQDDGLRERALQQLRQALGNDDSVALDASIGLFGQALAAAAEDDPGRPAMVCNLGMALYTRYKGAGDPADLDRAIEVGEQAVAALPAGHPDRALQLNGLGTALRTRFERTGDPADLDRAVTVSEEAVAGVPAGHPGRARYLPSLGRVLLARFDRAGGLPDLDRAIAVMDEAVTATGEGDPERAGRLSNLGAALRTRFRRAGVRGDLDMAVTVLNEAAALAPASHPDHAAIMGNLGNALFDRFERSGEQRDLARAVAAAEQAVAATPDDHPAGAARLNNLGVALHDRFLQTRERADLDRAVKAAEESAAATPVGQPDRAGRLSNLGADLRLRFEHGGVQEDLDRARTAFRDAAGLTPSPPLIRAEAARAWATVAGLDGDRDQAVAGLTAAVRLAGEVAPPGLMRNHQEHRMAVLTGLGPQAAAACLATGRTGLAVELFEQGRSVLFAQALDPRTDLTDLVGEHPGLAERFARLVGDLDAVVAVGPAPVSAENDVERRRATVAEFEKLLVEIRIQPGFGRFLLPRPVDELLAAAKDGPVVLINVAELRSDALILRPAGVEVVELREVTPAGVAGQVATFLGALADAQRRGAGPATAEAAEARLGEVLGWLWDAIAGPVLDRLGFAGPPGEGQPWPRVYWCPSGALAFLPLHAAGHHDTSAGPHPATVIDRVISSRIPTVRALLRAREAPAGPARGERAGGGGHRVLVTAMPATPGQADLPGAAAEAEALAGLFPGRVDVLGLPGTPPATHRSVTEALPGHAWAHFSCHGISHLNHPSASTLLLDDYRSRPLTVLDLSRARLEGAGLAFLSACSTVHGGEDLPDEPIHLASACQLAGFRHVIATMWPIDDNDAVSVTRLVYSDLAAHGAGPGADAASGALHHATRQLRLLYPRQPSRWAAHTHAGP